MTDTSHNGGPAFATGNPEQGGNEGMFLRDWFAGQALAGLVAVDRVEKLARASGHDYDELLTAMAFGIADAMLAAREET